MIVIKGKKKIIMKTTIKSSLIKVAILSASVLLTLSNAHAGNATASTQATATLSASCNLSINDMAFGQITPGLSATATSTVSVNCTKSSNYAIDFAYGNVGGSHLVGQNHGDDLPYIVEILQTGSYLTISQITGIGTGQNQSYGLQGFILNAEDESAQHIVPYITPDNYTDTITATMTF